MSVINLLFSGYLLFLSYIDIRYKELAAWMLAIGFVFVPVFFLLDSSLSILQCLLGLIPGGVFLFLSYATRGQVGVADAVLLLCIGLAKGLSGAIIVLGAALILAAFFSGVMLVTGKADRKTAIPFVPFLFLGASFFNIMGV